jgi:hypothetical protein
MEALGGRIDITVDHVGSQDMAGVGIRVAEEVGERNGREGVVIGVHIFEKLHDGGVLEDISDAGDDRGWSSDGGTFLAEGDGKLVDVGARRFSCSGTVTCPPAYHRSRIANGDVVCVLAQLFCQNGIFVLFFTVEI